MNFKLIPVLLVLGWVLVSNSMSFGQELNKLTAEYVSLNEDGQFLFMDKDEKEHIFDELNFEIEIDLYDESLIGTEFKMTWREEQYEEYDDEGNPTGNYLKYRIIESLEPTK